MRGLVISLLLVAWTTLAETLGQGQVNFATKVGTTVNGKFVDITGTAATSPPYLAGLLLQNPDGTLVYVPGSTTTFRTGAAAGYVTPIVATIPGHAAGTA